MVRMSISKETKQTLMGGIAGSLVVYMESAANGLVTGYPQILKDRLVPQIPRNGELLATIAPVGITYAVAKKKTSSRVQNVKNGVMMYDLPKLMGLFAYRIAYSAGLPAVGAPLRMFTPPQIRPSLVTRNTPVSMSAGRYVLKTSTPQPMGSGIGRYR